MKALLIMVIWLSNQGYGFGGDTVNVDVAWPIKGDVPATTLNWALGVEDLTLASGKVAMTDNRPVTVKLVLPEARVRIQLTWSFELVDGQGKVLSRGSHPIHVYARQPLRDLAPLLKADELVLWEDGDELSSTLAAFEVPAKAVDSLRELRFATPRLLIVGADKLKDRHDVAAVETLVKQGVGVIVLEQSGMTHLAGYKLGTRGTPADLTLTMPHPLFNSMSEVDARSVLTGGLDANAVLHAMELPEGADAVAVASWPVDKTKEEQSHVGPRDAMLVDIPLGAGRMVLIQRPMHGWRTDPRAAQLLANAVRHVMTRPTKPTTTERRDTSAQNETAPLLPGPTEGAIP